MSIYYFSSVCRPYCNCIAIVSNTKTNQVTVKASPRTQTLQRILFAVINDRRMPWPRTRRIALTLRLHRSFVDRRQFNTYTYTDY